MAQYGDIVICPKCGQEGEVCEYGGERALVIHRQHLVTRELPEDGDEVSWWSSSGHSPGEEVCGVDAETIRQLSYS